MFSSTLLLFLVLLATLNVYLINMYYKLSNKCDIMFSEIAENIKCMKIAQMMNCLNAKKCDDDETKKCELKKNKENNDELKEINIPYECLVNNQHEHSNNNYFYDTNLIEVSSDDETSLYSENNSDIDDDSTNTEDENYDENSIDNEDEDNDEKNIIDDKNINIKNIHVPLEIFDCINSDENVNVCRINNNETNYELNKLNESLNESSNEIHLNLEDLSKNEVVVQQKKKRESRKNILDNDYKKMSINDLRKYAIENGINVDVSKLKKTEIIKLIETYIDKDKQLNDKILHNLEQNEEEKELENKFENENDNKNE